MALITHHDALVWFCFVCFFGSVGVWDNFGHLWPLFWANWRCLSKQPRKLRVWLECALRCLSNSQSWQEVQPRAPRGSMACMHNADKGHL